jgi:hypothetical protein
MMGEILASDPDAPVGILGVNGFSYESGNGLVTQGRTIPWLQDTGLVDAWTQWNVTYRDVILLDEENRIIGVYNLTSHDLQVPENYDTLKQMILDAVANLPE